MARYWVYLNDDVAGPYTVEQLIRLRNFSRQTQVCIDDASGKPSAWISPAEIPELAHIFKAVDDHMTAPPSKPAPKSAPRPVARAPRAYTPAVTLRAPDPTGRIVAWLVFSALLAGGAFLGWSEIMKRTRHAEGQQAAQRLVENASLPPNSLYRSLRHYMQEKSIKPQWEFAREQDGLYNTTVSWDTTALVVYAFEANVQAQTVRGLNTAAIKLLADGFPAPAAPKTKPLPAAKKSPAELFGPALASHREAFEGGDFSMVWNSFSKRKRQEMAKGGISEDGFVRLQGLTRRVESPVKEEVLKTKAESDEEMLVLLKQTQSGRPDIFVKQFWIFEAGSWKLDDEQKKSSEPKEEPTTPRTESAPASPAPAPRVEPAKLPGMGQ